MDKLKQIPDLFIHMSLCLQALFGLRRAESIKIIPKWADRGDRLVLKASWTKGGREREIPIRTPEQQQLVDQAKALAKGKSLRSEVPRHLEQDRVCLGQAAEVGPAIPINLPAREAFASFSAGPGSTVLLPLPWCARPAALVYAHDAPRPCGY
jgi:hypothetical protein